MITNPLSVFGLTLLLLLLASAVPFARRRVFGPLSNGIWALSTARAGLTGGLSEIPKFGLIRIIFGALLLNRLFYMWYLSYPTDWQNPIYVLTLFAELAAALAILLGFATQWAFVHQMLYQWHAGEAVLGNGTLGNDIAAILSLFLFLTNAGSRISLDGILTKRTPVLRPFLLYWGTSDRDVVVSKFIALFSYWLICIYSMAQHLAEPAWMKGFAGPQLLANNFMSVYHASFASYFETSEILVLLAKLGLWGMFPWYLGVLPLVLLGGWFRAYVIGWGILFFVLSHCVLQLGWLAEFEWLLWASLFLYSSRKVDVAYDDKCNLCDRTIQFLKLVDLSGNICLRPVSKSKSWLDERGITQESALYDLHAWDRKQKKLYSGYDFYLTLSASIAPLMPLWPVLMLCRITAIGPQVYRIVADRRIRMLGACKMPSQKREWVSPQNYARVSFSSCRSAIAMHVIILGAFYTAGIPWRFVGWSGFQTPFAAAAHYYGIAPIDVFNKTDLRMAENWFTLKSEKNQIVPIFNPDGSRGWYHKSDRIYFGGTLRFRRMVIGRNDCHYNNPRWKHLINQILLLHKRITGETGPFIYTQYFSALADDKKINNLSYERGSTRIVCSMKVPS